MSIDLTRIAAAYTTFLLLALLFLRQPLDAINIGLIFFPWGLVAAKLVIERFDL